MTKRVWIYYILACVLTSCAGTKTSDVRIPVYQNDISPLVDGKSRVFFYLGAPHRSYHNYSRVSTPNGVLVKDLRDYRCVYIDFPPGEYTFVAENSVIMGGDDEYSILLKPGDTNYLKWTFQRRTFSQSSHFVHVTAEQGKEEADPCFLVESNQ